MASNAMAKTAFFLTLNLLFFTLVTSTHTPKGCPPPPPPPCPPSTKPPVTPSPKPPTPSPKPPTPSPKPPVTPSPKPPTPSPKPPTPSPKPPTPSPKATCPKDTLKLGVCGDLLSGLINVVIGTPPKTKCCGLIQGLADLDAAVCLCTAIKANVLGINLNVPVSLSLLLNYCGKKVPSGFQCA